MTVDGKRILVICSPIEESSRLYGRNEDRINTMLPNKLPTKIQALYDHGHC